LPQKYFDSASVVNKDLSFKAKALSFKAKAKDLSFKAKAKAKDLSFKAKAKDLSFKAKAKDLSFKAKAKAKDLPLSQCPQKTDNLTGKIIIITDYNYDLITSNC